MRKCAQRFNIKGFQQITLIDWDGKIASTIFLGGCNFKCGFCHSRSLVLGNDRLDTIPFEDIEGFLKQKKGWVDGVVITGGEPTLDEKNLFDLICAIKNLDLLVKLDTNGSRPEALKKLLDSKIIDYVAMDIKAPLKKDAYSNACGVDVVIEDIIASKDILISSNIDYEFRTTVVPGITGLADILEIARLISPAKKYAIQQFVPRDTIDPLFLVIKPYPLEELYKMAAVCSEFLLNVVVRRN